MTDRPSRKRDRLFVQLAEELMGLHITAEARERCRAVINAKTAKARRAAVEAFEAALCAP